MGRQADDMGACSKGEDKDEGQQKQKIRCEGQTSRLQDTALAPPSTATLIIHLKVQAGGTDWTEQANKLGAIGDLKLILGHKCGIPEHELPFCKDFLAIWFCGYPLDDNKTIEECGELCDDSEISIEGVQQALDAIQTREAQALIAETGVPEGCTDYRVCPEAKKLVESDKEETWRCAGHAKVGFGFELTQDADDQEGHLLCRHPFEAKADEIHCTFVYTMKPKNFQEGGGQGLCAYICDPSVPGWDRHFDGSGPLGFVGKKGAILGVGIDCTGTFCEGEPSSVAVKRAADNKLLCDPVVLEGGVATKEKSDYWRKVHIKFDIEKMEIDVKIGGQQVLKDVKIDLGEGVKLPKVVCIGVCAGTADGHNNHICINKLKLKSEE